MIIDNAYIKSALRYFETYKNSYIASRKNIILLIDSLAEEEESLILPSKSNGDNLGITSRGATTDSVFESFTKIDRARIDTRRSSLMKKLDKIRETEDFLTNIISIFMHMAIVCPIHFSIVDEYLFHKTLKYRELAKKYKKSNETLKIMVEDFCECICEVINNELNLDDLTLDSFSKELNTRMKKNELE